MVETLFGWHYDGKPNAFWGVFSEVAERSGRCVRLCPDPPREETAKVIPEVSSTSGGSAVADDPTNAVEEPKAPRNGHRHGPGHGRLHQRLHSHPALAITTKLVVTVVGTLVALVGVVMLVTPGPAFVMIPLGLAILATEWEWARRWLDKAKEQAVRARAKAEAMDPRVRRRRLVLTGIAALAVVAAVVAYVISFDWPTFAVRSWDRLQSLAAWVPELPGM
jgi:uncharacterized protein (TIGR02611 family)